MQLLGGDCSIGAEDWAQLQALVNVKYGECVERAAVGLSVCILLCDITQSGNPHSIASA